MKTGINPSINPRIELGQAAESAARSFLIAQGHRIIEQNLRLRRGEIDVISEVLQQGQLFLVFTEVRCRSTEAGLRAIETFSAHKILAIHRAAQGYLARYRGRARSVRLDLIEVYGQGQTPVIRHYPNFF